MVEIKASDADDLFVKTCLLLKDKEVFARRGMKIKEVLEYHAIIRFPFKAIITNYKRKLSRSYLKDEFEWYKSGDLSVRNISKTAKMWSKIADDEGNANSNYGFIAFKQLTSEGISQFEWCKQKLEQDRYTRQAVINYNQPHHKVEGNKDFVCTISNQFMVNPETECLDMIVNMRSNDLIYGLSYDLPWFAYVLHKMVESIGIKAGMIYHNATSLHVYEKHFKMIDDVCRDHKGNPGEPFYSDDIREVLIKK